MLNTQLRVFIWMIFNKMKGMEDISISAIPLNFSEGNNEYIKGTVNFMDVNITGINRVENDINDISVEEEADDGSNYVCVNNIKFDYLYLHTNYLADVGILDEIPIYGEGKITFAMEKIELNICGTLNVDDDMKGAAYNIKAVLKYRHKPVEFTGFWKNEEVSTVLAGVLNVANKLTAMWGSYDPEQFSCIISPFVEYAVNIYFENEENSFKFNSSCFLVEFPGFWKNEEVSTILAGILNVAKKLTAMWCSNDPEQFLCMMSPFVEYAVNGYEENSFKFNSAYFLA